MGYKQSSLVDYLALTAVCRTCVVGISIDSLRVDTFAELSV